MNLSNKKNIPLIIQRLLSARKYNKALSLIEASIADSGGLFSDAEETFEMRRATWLLRIDILRNIGRHAEALAWTCLECELNPENITAVALKKQLLAGLNLQNRTSFSSSINLTRDFQKDWNGVAGMRQLKSILETEIVLPLLERELYLAYKIPIPSGVIFHGPPGCGKSFIAKNLAERLKLKCFKVNPSEFASIYVHGGQENIKIFFEKMTLESPCVIIFEELDAILPNRKNDLSHSYSSEVNEFLIHLEQAASKDILIIGTTNHLDKIDSAAIRPGRFDLKVLVEVPDLEARHEFIMQYMKDRPSEFIDWDLLADNTEDYSFSDLKLLIDSVAKTAISQKEQIGMKHFYKILKIK